MQMGFIEFVVAPLITGVINIFPSLYEIGQNLQNNMHAWGDKRKLEINESEVPDKQGECKKVDERLTKFTDKMRFLEELKGMCSSAQRQQYVAPKRRKSVLTAL